MYGLPGLLDISRQTLEQIRELARRHAEDNIVLASRVTYSCLVAAWVISVNAVLMFIVESTIELLVLFSWFPKMPFRLDFFSLTLLSAILGVQTMNGIANRQLEVTANALLVSGAVEAFLITGDIAFMVEFEASYPVAIPVRIPFIVLTVINLILVLYLYLKLHAWQTLTRHSQTSVLEKSVAPSAASDPILADGANQPMSQ